MKFNPDILEDLELLDSPETAEKIQKIAADYSLDASALEQFMACHRLYIAWNREFVALFEDTWPILQETIPGLTNDQLRRFYLDAFDKIDIEPTLDVDPILKNTSPQNSLNNNQLKAADQAASSAIQETVEWARSHLAPVKKQEITASAHVHAAVYNKYSAGNIKPVVDDEVKGFGFTKTAS